MIYELNEMDVQTEKKVLINPITNKLKLRIKKLKLFNQTINPRKSGINFFN
jgi:hypothetical protein